MAKGLGRAHFRYANYFQARLRGAGDLWQNRFYSCPLSQSHLLRVMRYFRRRINIFRKCTSLPSPCCWRAK
jgi:hypothetical protein